MRFSNVMTKWYGKVPAYIITVYVVLLAFDFAWIRIYSQTPQQSLTTVVYSNITSASILDGCDPTPNPCLDNRSAFTRESSTSSYRAFGTGTWSVDMQWADVNPTVWTSFGSTAVVNNSGPSSGIGYGIGPASIQKPYHDFIRFVIIGNATIMNYTGTRQFWWLPSVASIAFPLTAVQGGTYGAFYVDQLASPFSTVCSNAASLGLMVLVTVNQNVASSFTCNAPSVAFTSSGKITLGSGQNVTFVGSVNCPAGLQCFDTSLAGSRGVVFASSALLVNPLGPEAWGSAGNGTTNDYAAIQAAVDSLCGYVVGGPAAISRPVYLQKQYLLGTTLNLTTANRVTNGTIVRDGCHIYGSMYSIAATGGILIGGTGTGYAIFETTGSQGVVIENVGWQSAATSASTVGMYTAVSTSLPESQNVRLVNTNCSMATNTTANGGLGTICLWNFGSEEHTYDTTHWTADRPVLLTAYHTNPATYGHSYEEGDLLASHSLGVTTFSGEDFFATWNLTYAPFYTVDINSLDIQNGYFGCLNTSTGTNSVAMEVHGTSDNMHWHGTDDPFATPLYVYGQVEHGRVDLTLGAVTSTTASYIGLDFNQGYIDNSEISFRQSAGTPVSRPLFSVNPSGPQAQIGSYVANTTIRTDLAGQYIPPPENLIWNPLTANDRFTGASGYSYEIPQYGQARTTIPPTIIKTAGGSDNSGYISELVWPTTVSAVNVAGMNITVHVKGSVGVQTPGSNAQSGTAVDLVGTLAANYTNGAITAPATLYSTLPQGIQTNISAGGNNIAGMGVVLSTTCPTLPSATACVTKLVAIPVITGVNTDAITFTGLVEITWIGGNSRGPTLQPLTGPVSGTSYTQPAQLFGNYIASECTGSNTPVIGCTAGSANNAIIVYTPPGIGTCITIALSHSLQAGANTLNLNGITAAVRSRYDSTGNITTAYTANGIINVCGNNSTWQEH